MLKLNRCLAFLLFFLLTSAASGQDLRLVFSIADENGRPVSTIKPSDITLRTKTGAVGPASINYVGDASLNVVILIDVSSSQERTIPRQKAMADAFIERELKSDRDKVGIIKFSQNLGLVYDLGNDFTLARTRLKEIDFELPAGYTGGGIVVSRTPSASQSQWGSTPLFDSIHKVLSVVGKLKEEGRRNAILVISDGFNTAGDKKLKEVIAASIQTDTPIFAVGIGDPFYDGLDEKGLRRLTEPTGGIAIFPKEKNPDLSDASFRLGAILRNYYVANFAVGTSSLQDAKVEIINPALKKLHVFSTKNP